MSERRRHRVVINAWRDAHHPSAGGSELVTDIIGAGLAQRGHEVLLRAGEASERTAPLPTVSSGGAYSQYLLGPVKRQGLSTADVVIDINNGMPFLSPLWHRRASVCVVHHLHLEQWGMYFPKPVAAVGKRVEALSIEWAYRAGLYATISPSSAEALEQLGVPADRIRELRMPVHGALQECAPAPKSTTPQFVAVGRIVANKRHDKLLDIWQRVYRQTGGELLIVGDGPERERLEARNEPGVRFMGRVDDPTCAALLSSSWALVHTAAHEGWGLVLSEAAWFGTPSIAFNVPGVRDALQRHHCGWGVQSDEEFAATWLSLAQSPDQLHARGRQAATAVRESGQVEHLVDDMEDIVDEAISLHQADHVANGWTSTRKTQPSIADTSLPTNDAPPYVDVQPRGNRAGSHHNLARGPGLQRGSATAAPARRAQRNRSIRYRDHRRR